MRGKKPELIASGLCIGVLILFFTAILVTVFTRFILVKHFGITNAFTEFVFADNWQLNSDAETGMVYDIDWEELYPFEEGDPAPETEVSANQTSPYQLLHSWKSRIDRIEDKIESYSSKLLIGYRKMTEAAKTYDGVIGWNFASFGEYNGVVELPDGYLTTLVEQQDVSEQITALEDFYLTLKAENIPLLYVQIPHKISETEDADLSGYADFSNQNFNQLLSGLEEKVIDVLDLRARIREENLRHHELFYRTDHHWLTTTGIWAAKEILDYCNTRYHFQAETERLLPEQFLQKVYPEWFLGSQGKKVTLARTEPDDFTLLYPKYPTLFHFIVPAAGVDETSDYSVVYDMTEITVKDYYGKNPYSGCGYGEQPLVRIQNLENADNRRVLVLRDSFGDCLIPGLALCEREIDALDLRLFSGSVISYVEQNKPDLVVVLYSAASIGGAVNYHSHRDMFDFR